MPAVAASGAAENTALLAPLYVDQARTGYTWAGEAEAHNAPEKTGTIFSSAMNLAACALGASMLSLPYAMMLSGPIVAIEFLVIFAIMAYFAAQAVVDAGIRCNKSTYSEIVRFYFGTSQGIFADVLLSLALAVAAISYIVGLADLLPVSVSIRLFIQVFVFFIYCIQSIALDS